MNSEASHVSLSSSLMLGGFVYIHFILKFVCNLYCWFFGKDVEIGNDAEVDIIDLVRD